MDAEDFRQLIALPRAVFVLWALGCLTLIAVLPFDFVRPVITAFPGGYIGWLIAWLFFALASFFVLGVLCAVVRVVLFVANR